MSDAYWPTVLPRLWARVRATLKEDDEEEEDDDDDEDSEEEEEDEGHCQMSSQGTSSQGMKCPAKRTRSS